MLMIRRSSLPSVRSQEGTTMMEVLVSIIIVVVGLLGLAGLQSRVALSEVEAFQRAQAVVLLQDMVGRLNANRKRAADYVTASPMGTGQSSQNCSAKTGADRDLCEWSNALLGASESSGGLKVGAMIGARGCVANTVAAMPSQYVVSVVWQGVNRTVAPGATACGSGLYGDEKTRRGVTATVMIGCLQNDPASLACITTP
jgi:type IV pilus assembly protein PilV